MLCYAVLRGCKKNLDYSIEFGRKFRKASKHYTSKLQRNPPNIGTLQFETKYLQSWKRFSVFFRLWQDGSEHGLGTNLLYILRHIWYSNHGLNAEIDRRTDNRGNGEFLETNWHKDLQQGTSKNLPQNCSVYIPDGNRNDLTSGRYRKKLRRMDIFRRSLFRFHHTKHDRFWRLCAPASSQ